MSARITGPMTDIFFNPYGRLRSGWRLTIFLLVLIVLDIVWEQVVRTLYGLVSTYRSIPYPEFLLGLAFRGGLLVIALGLGYACAHILEELPWRSLGASLHKGWFKDLIIGSVLGFLTLAVAVVITMAGRGVSFALNPIDWAAVIKSMIASGVLL